MNLHNAIMNIQIDEEALFYKHGNEALYAYKEGHRDARHRAAELSLKAESRIEYLEGLVEKLLDALCDCNADDYVDMIRENYGFNAGDEE